MSVNVVVNFQASDGNAESLLPAAREGRDLSRKADGCEAFDLFQRQDDPHKFMFIERWTSIDAHHANMADEHRRERSPREDVAASGRTARQRRHRDRVVRHHARHNLPLCVRRWTCIRTSSTDASLAPRRRDAGALAACGGSPTASVPDSTTSTTVRPCGINEVGCSSDRVITTVALAYQSGGATVAEALCLANATASGKTAVNEAFYTPTKAQSRRMVSCVGSDARSPKNRQIDQFREVAAGSRHPITAIGLRGSPTHDREVFVAVGNSGRARGVQRGMRCFVGCLALTALLAACSSSGHVSTPDRPERRAWATPRPPRGRHRRPGCCAASRCGAWSARFPQSRRVCAQCRSKECKRSGCARWVHRDRSPQRSPSVRTIRPSPGWFVPSQPPTNRRLSAAVCAAYADQPQVVLAKTAG